MDRRTFLAAIGGAFLFPGVPEKGSNAPWIDITPPDYDGKMWRHDETGEIQAISETLQFKNLRYKAYTEYMYAMDKTLWFGDL